MQSSTLSGFAEPSSFARKRVLIESGAYGGARAVSYDDVRAVVTRLPTHPEVISLDPERLADVIADVTRLAEAAGAAERAEELRRRLESRLQAVREAVAGAPRPRVLALEWLDPVFIAATGSRR